MFYHYAEAKVTFSDVIGCDEAKGEVQQIVDFIKQPQKYTDLGATVPRYVVAVVIAALVHY
jgi:cell division protease FtsH